MTKTIAFASDHAGYALKEVLKSYIDNMNNYRIVDLGTNSLDSVDYPLFGQAAGKAVTSGEADLAIIICGSGVGISIAANRIAGVRAALCHNALTAQLSRRHNDANILALGARIIDESTAIECVDSFISTDFEGGRHLNRVNMLGSVEKLS